MMLTFGYYYFYKYVVIATLLVLILNRDDRMNHSSLVHCILNALQMGYLINDYFLLLDQTRIDWDSVLT